MIFDFIAPLMNSGSVLPSNRMLPSLAAAVGHTQAEQADRAVGRELCLLAIQPTAGQYVGLLRCLDVVCGRSYNAPVSESPDWLRFDCGHCMSEQSLTS